MSINICAIQEKRLIDRLHSLKLKGEIIEKRILKPSGDQPERRVVIIRFKDRRIEKQLDYSQFDRIEIGEQMWFSPPVPERDPCNCHLFVWLIGAIIVGALAIWAITSHFYGRTAILLSLVAAGWVSVITWANICCHEQNKCLRDLERELRFFETSEYEAEGQI